MKLEDAIKQKKFRNPKQKAILNIYYTNGFITSAIEEVMKPFDLTPQQYNILRILRGQHPNSICMGEVKERMLDKNSDVSRIVERLRLKKLLDRKIAKTDRRHQNISITDKGLSLLAEIDKHEQQLDSMLDSLSEKEAKQLNELLDKIRG